MARDRYRVIKGLDYAGRRAEPGDVVDDLPEESVMWLIECGAVEPLPAETSQSRAKPRSRPAGTERKGETK